MRKATTKAASMQWGGLIFTVATFAATVSCYAREPAKTPALAAGHDARKQQLWGIQGNASNVRRTIQVRMSDAMRFVPGSIEVREGDTVRFVVANDGKLMHELVLGTKRELDTHAGAMARSSNMTHDQ